ncbi:hypothetical protein BH10CHL1_BH10CHL1_35930 [soil metagenome]
MQVFFPSTQTTRVKTTYPYELLDANPAHELDELTVLVAQICQTPIAFIILADADRQWIKSQVGWSASTTSPGFVFCTQTMLQSDLLIVRDVYNTEQFVANPLLLGEPSIRFYAGAPLITTDGAVLGVLCVMDRAPRDLNPTEQQSLRTLSRQVVTQLELHRHIAERQQAEAALHATEARLRTLVENVNVISWEAEPVSRRFTYVGPQAVEIFGYPLEAWYQADFWMQHIHPADREQALQFSWESSTRANNYEFEYRMLAADGRTVWLRDIVNVTRKENRPQLLRGFTLNITVHKQAEQEIQRRAVHAEALRAISLAAVATQDLAELLKITLIHLLKALDLTHGEIWAPPYHISCNLPAEPIESEPGIGKIEIDAATPLAVVDWQQMQTTQPMLQRQAEIMQQAGKRASLTVPLMVGEQSIGGMSLLACQPREWASEEIALAVAIGQQVGTASHRLRTEAALQESEARYQRIADITSYYALTIRLAIDKNLAIEWATPGFEHITGYTSQEMIELGGMIKLIPTAAVDNFVQSWRTLHQGQPCVYEYPITARSGELHWLREHAHPAWDAAGEILHVYITGEDITERKQAEDELHRIHALYRRAIAAADAVPYQREYATDSFIFMGEAIHQITGYTAAEITPPILDHLSLETIMRGETEGLTEEEAIRRTRLGEFYRWRCDSRILTRTGTERWISDASVEMYDEHGKPSASIGILMDITDRKQAEMELKESNRRLAEALTELRQTQQQLIQQERLRAVGTMASGIAHDFNNMLAPILGFTELLLLGSKNQGSPEKETRYLRAIHMAAQNAATVISRLREFYRYRDGTEPQLPVDLHLIVEQTVLLTQPHWKDQALARGVPVRIETILQPVPVIKGSKAELQEMLTNLILNAADAVAADGKITIRVFTDPGKPGQNLAGPGATNVVLEVSDTGMGMDAETQRRCFEPFFSTKGLQGTGLGLAVVYGIVQRHEGRIEVDSAVGQGTTFRIYLPVPLQTPELIALPEPQSERPLHVLVVDDDPIVRDVVVEYLAYEEHSTETAANGSEGLEKFRAGRFDLVITDRAMPKLNGDGLAAAIKAVASDTPVILLTGFGEFMNADGELPWGVDYIMSKPLTLKNLQQTIGLARGKFS